MESEKKFCPVIQAECKGNTCQWWIDLSGVAKYPPGKEPGECAVKSIALTFKSLKEEGAKVNVLKIQGEFEPAR